MGAGERSQIHHLGRPHDVELHQVDEGCASGQIFDWRPALDQRELREHRNRPNCRNFARSTVINKRAHRSALIWALAWATAETMFGYAEQRHRLPLMYSRIASSLPAWPSFT